MIEENSRLMYDVVENMDSMVRVMDREDTIIFMNEKMREQFGDFRGKKCYEMMGLTQRCKHCISDECLKTGKSAEKQQRCNHGYYQVVASPVKLGEHLKDKYAIEIFEDVTKRRQIEQENMIHYQKMKEDIKFAKQVQKNVLPANRNYWDALYISSFYEPSEELSGDLFDVVRLDDNRILFYMADVSGHGIRSSLLTIFLRQILRSSQVKSMEPEALIQELISQYRDLNVGDEQYFTILAAIYNKMEMEMEFINAGHNCLPLLVRAEKGFEEIHVGGMPVCSLIEKVNHESVRIKVRQGDRIVLYTDGLSESYSEEKKKYFEIDEIKKTIEKHKNIKLEDLAERLVEEAEMFSGQKNKDDIAVLIAEVL